MKCQFFVVLWLLASTNTAQAQKEPVIGLPCEGCNAVFDGMPAQLGYRARIAPKTEPGTQMVIVGRVLDQVGKARPGIIVYAYQTNARGIYPEAHDVRDPETRRQGTLRAWVKTDAAGRYAFETIRPGSYPDEDIPEHIHFHVVEPGCGTYYIDDIMFTDDAKLTAQQIKRIAKDRGGNGVSTPVMHHGVWHVTRDIILGQSIPNYRVCESHTVAPRKP